MLIAVGSIHPESGAWYFEEPLQLPFHDGDWTVVIHDSQFHVIVSGQQPTNVASFRNELTSIVQGCLDSLGFLFAVPLQAEVRSIVMQGENDQVQLALRRHGWPELLDGQPELPLRAEASDLQPLVAATVQVPLARLALLAPEEVLMGAGGWEVPLAGRWLCGGYLVITVIRCRL